MAEPALHEKLKTLAVSISELQLESIVHPEKGGPYNFEDNRQRFQNILDFYRDVTKASLVLLPEQHLETMRASAEEVLKAFKESVILITNRSQILVRHLIASETI